MGLNKQLSEFRVSACADLESETKPDSQDAGTVCVRLTRHPSLEAATLCKRAVKSREPTEKWGKGTTLKHFVSDPVKKMTGI